MRWSRLSSTGTFFVVGAMFVTAVAVRAAITTPVAAVENEISDAVLQDREVLRGRQLVLTHACGECHGGGDNPAAQGWLTGVTSPMMEFKIGPPPCGVDPKATGCFTTRPRNLTPDNETGMGRFTERQLFNALRYGLRPEDTPDVTIKGTKPGEGNFPMRPHYLAPPMPWNAWRHMPDADLRAIAAYIKRGLKPVVNKVADSEGPPDFWASAMTPENIGEYPAVPFPTANEQEPPASQRRRVLRGRELVIQSDCGACHRGASPTARGWLAGITAPTQAFVIGPCFVDEKQPCFTGRPKNLTPDKETGIGRFTDQQLFNALRYGLKPLDTPDVKITSNVPGQGNFPKEPHYLGPFMPWASWRFNTDEDIWSIIAYLRHGLKPVRNEVPLSDDPPDHWASIVATIGPNPPPPFPTVNEVGGK